MKTKIVKKTLALAAAVLPLAAWTQQGSGVQLYGIIDAALRHTTKEGASQSGLTRMIGGGMSQSRWGVNLSEDLGQGLAMLGKLESRFASDSGTQTGSSFFLLSWFGLRSDDWGRLTLGRQYTMLFDLMSTTYVPFPYTPYLDTFKPEVGMQLGAIANNSIKYYKEFGPMRAAFQYHPFQGLSTLMF